MKIAFVVLHYKVDAITKKCIDYLLDQDYKNYKIIVIDNCSNNNSYERLRNEYTDNKLLYFVSIEHNLGFAKANNLGYQIGKHKFKAECIVVINNDLFIKDNAFCEKLSSFGKDKLFHIMGPDIINKTGIHQNPLVNCVTDKNSLQRMIILTRIKIFFVPLLFRLKRQISTKYVNIQENYSNKYMENVPLHGSCMIFGKAFVDTFEFPFYPNTFLYGEEDILFYLSRKRGIKTIFNPNLVVYHVEDVSTESVTKNYKNKRLFELKNSLNSLKILKELMNKEE